MRVLTFHNTVSTNVNHLVVVFPKPAFFLLSIILIVDTPDCMCMEAQQAGKGKEIYLLVLKHYVEGIRGYWQRWCTA